MNCLAQSQVEKMKPLDNDYVVVMGSHTKNDSGTHGEIVKKGTMVYMDVADNGTKWITWGFSHINKFGSLVFKNNGKIERIANA